MTKFEIGITESWQKINKCKFPSILTATCVFYDDV